MLAFLAGMGLLELVIFLGLFAFWIWSMIDVVRNAYMKASTRPVWLLVIILFPFLGTIVYLLFATRKSVS